MASDPESGAEKGTEPIRAAGYARLSVEQYQHSQDNQKSAICHYGENRKLHIAVIFSDQGKVNLRSSGLTESWK